MKKENAFLKQSLTVAQPPRRSTWRGFRENVEASSDGSQESESSSILTNEGRSQTSGYARRSPAPTAEWGLGGFLGELERCQIRSRSTSPVGHPSRDSFALGGSSMVSSVGSTSSGHFVTEDCFANLRGNRMDLILAVDRQRISTQPGLRPPITTAVEGSL